jgi:capsule biosynthesis phosphatase
MIKETKVLVVDVDGTLCLDKDSELGYASAVASQSMKLRLTELKSNGYWIILFTSRNMRTHDGNIGAIIKHTAPVLIQWLAENDIPYDELHFGKPWCGNEGFYIDDRAIRPREFLDNSIEQINALLERDRVRL